MQKPQFDQWAAVHVAAHSSATSPWSGLPKPTQAQLAANSYKTGRFKWKGLDLRIENAQGTERSGVGKGGKPWRNVMRSHYGFIAGTKGADADGIDVFIGPDLESDRVWVINQSREGGGFDEHKLMLGFVDQRHAEMAYLRSYSIGWRNYSSPIGITVDQLKLWLKSGDKSRAFSLNSLPEQEMPEATMQRVRWNDDAYPMFGATLDSVLYDIRRHDSADGLLLDSVSMADVAEGASVIQMDALVSPVGKLKPKMEALMRVMEIAGDEVKPVAVQFSELLRRYGGVHVAAVYELSDGQTITAWLHNPDSTPNKITPVDTLVSWKWQLNKKDVTIVVAPESGADLNAREVARRLMRLAAKNSAAFKKANTKRAERMGNIEALRKELEAKRTELSGLNDQIEAARLSSDIPREAPAMATQEPPVPEPVPKDNQEVVSVAEEPPATGDELLPSASVDPSPATEVQAQSDEQIGVPATGSPTVEDPPIATSPSEFEVLKAVSAGKHDSLSLLDLYEKIATAAQALQDRGLLIGDAESAAKDAITHWADIESAATA